MRRALSSRPRSCRGFEQLSVAAIAPTVQAVGLVAGRDRLFRDVFRTRRGPARTGGCIAGKILLVGFLEEPAAVLTLAVRVVVLDREQPMPRWPGLGPRITNGMSATAARAALAASRTGNGQGIGTSPARSWSIAVGHLRESATAGAQHNVLRVAGVWSVRCVRSPRYRPASPGGRESHAASGVNVTSPAAVSPGPRTMTPVSVRPAAARLKPSMQLVAGSTQKKSWPAGV